MLCLSPTPSCKSRSGPGDALDIAAQLALLSAAFLFAPGSVAKLHKKSPAVFQHAGNDKAKPGIRLGLGTASLHMQMATSCRPASFNELGRNSLGLASSEQIEVHLFFLLFLLNLALPFDPEPPNPAKPLTGSKPNPYSPYYNPRALEPQSNSTAEGPFPLRSTPNIEKPLAPRKQKQHGKAIESKSDEKSATRSSEKKGGCLLLLGLRFAAACAPGCSAGCGATAASAATASCAAAEP